MKIRCLLFLAFISCTTNAQHVSQWPRVVSYEIFVQAFADSNGDGIGDIKGMISKLDYLKDLGIESVWLMPMSPSPSYHKYDVTDYYGIHPDYGTLDDFKTFVTEAHNRNIKVVIDLVLNHCSREHPWFKAAASDPNSPYREYFVWTHKDDPQLKISVTHTEEDSHNRNRWNKVDGSDYLYYSYFGGHMPDLNFDSPKLREEVFKIGRFWFSDMGVDGFRLDAARHIFHDERATDNHNWWVYFSSEMRKVKKDAYMVGEVWSSSDVVAPYLKGIPALFNFDLASAIKKAVNESNTDSLAIRHQKINSFYQTINPDFVDATFLSNHDQERVMSSFDHDINKAKAAAAILLTLPGAPYIYYGEEIGMHGKKPDEYIREPFLWDTKEKDKGRTRWVTPRHSSDSTVAPAAKQIKDRTSLLNYYKTLIALRNTSNALTYGKIEPVNLGKKEVCAFQRKFQEEELLVLHNVSKTGMTIDLPENLKLFNKIKYASGGAGLKNNKLILPAYGTALLIK